MSDSNEESHRPSENRGLHKQKNQRTVAATKKLERRKSKQRVLSSFERSVVVKGVAHIVYFKYKKHDSKQSGVLSNRCSCLAIVNS